MRRAIALVLCLAAPSWATIATVHANAGAAACASTITSSTLGNLLVVMCESQSGAETASVSDNASGGSNTYTKIAGAIGILNSGVATSTLWYSQTTNGGATTVTCAGACYGSRVYEYSGALASGNPVDVSSGSVQLNCVGSACTCPTFSTTNSGDAVFASAIPGASISAVVAPYGNFQGDSNGSGTADYIPGTTLTNNAVVWTDAGDFFACAIAAILPAAGAAATSSTLTITPGSGQLTITPGAGTLTVK